MNARTELALAIAGAAVAIALFGLFRVLRVALAETEGEDWNAWCRAAFPPPRASSVALADAVDATIRENIEASSAQPTPAELPSPATPLSPLDAGDPRELHG